MDIKNMTEDEVVDVLEQIREICDSVKECCAKDCIFARIYKDPPNQVCPFNQTPFRFETEAFDTCSEEHVKEFTKWLYEHDVS